MIIPAKEQKALSWVSAHTWCILSIATPVGRAQDYTGNHKLIRQRPGIPIPLLVHPTRKGTSEGPERLIVRDEREHKNAA